MSDHKPDKQLISKRFARSFRKKKYPGIIQAAMAKYLLDLLSARGPASHYANVLELGCGISSMAPAFLKQFTAETWTANDIVPVEETFCECIKDSQLQKSSFILGDMETLDLPDQQDLIVSTAAIQWTKSPADFLSGLIRKLRPGGILAFATFGPDNLHELREVTGLSLNYLSSSDYPPVFSHDGEILCMEELKSVMQFDSPLAVLRHLKETGTNSLSRQSWTRGDVTHFSEVYRARFGEDDKVNLTYHPLYLIFQRSSGTQS